MVLGTCYSSGHLSGDIYGTEPVELPGTRMDWWGSGEFESRRPDQIK